MTTHALDTFYINTMTSYIIDVFINKVSQEKGARLFRGKCIEEKLRLWFYALFALKARVCEKCFEVCVFLTKPRKNRVQDK